ncbi:MAG: aldo/keto reductase, partial [Aliidongia sp.]
MREIQATLESAIGAGINFFDTADIYGQGDSERTLARLLRRYKERMFVVTKVGGRHGRYAGIVRRAKPLLRMIVRSRPELRSVVVKARTATVSQNFSPLGLMQAVDASRRRLGLERLDGLLLHSPSAETLGTSEIRDFLGDILHAGKASYVGVSVDTFEAAEAAIAIPELSMLQAPMDVAEEISKSPVLEQIRQRNIGFFVRDVLRKAHEGSSFEQAVSAAISPDFVSSAIVGVSTRKHLDDLLSVV